MQTDSICVHSRPFALVKSGRALNQSLDWPLLPVLPADEASIGVRTPPTEMRLLSRRIDRKPHSTNDRVDAEYWLAWRHGNRELNAWNN
jgi:hypothetical protein